MTREKVNRQEKGGTKIKCPLSLLTSIILHDILG
nr:MAG TPA: hypothetical protein [Caudoviricetes sp.]DAY61275.1 MAG TPA: hypothetical protein [Caudoviricetes sp.]